AFRHQRAHQPDDRKGCPEVRYACAENIFYMHMPENTISWPDWFILLLLTRKTSSIWGHSS
ncbi:MAG: hypothetical protein ACXV7C_15030, partial [Candidatus Angelobacter sp.]